VLIDASTVTNVPKFYSRPRAGQAKKAEIFSGRIDPETGECAGPTPTLIERASAGRARRYALLGAIRRIDPTHRTAKCAWSRVSVNGQINVVRDGATGKARYSGLQVCARIWTCPVCAAKISERRAVELAQAIGVSRSMNIRVMLLTATVPHLIGDSLQVLIQRLGVAWRSFSTGRISARLRADIELVGTIRNIEVTHGVNGWHPHFHCLVFFRADVAPESIAAAWSEHWQHCAVKAGLRRPGDEHGLTLQAGDYAARYVSKWGLEHEMTKSMAKQARKGGRTPFDIADDFGDGLDPARNAGLWREFAGAMHGQRQLHWSRGLKALFEVGEADDAELVAEEDARPAELVVQLTWPEWRAVRARHRAVLLDLAEQAPHLVRDWLDGRVSAAAAAAVAASAGAVGVAL
jgi:hypothetical protein